MNRFTQFYLNKLALYSPGNPGNSENLIPETLLGRRPVIGSTAPPRSTAPPMPDPPSHPSGPLTPQQQKQIADVKAQARNGAEALVGTIAKGTAANQIGNGVVKFIQNVGERVPAQIGTAANQIGNGAVNLIENVSERVPEQIATPAAKGLMASGASAALPLANMALGAGVGMVTDYGLNGLGQAFPNTPIIKRLNNKTVFNSPEHPGVNSSIRPDDTPGDALANSLVDTGKDFISGAAGGFAATRHPLGALAGGIGTAAVGTGVRAYKALKKEPITFGGVKGIAKNMLGLPNQGEIEGERRLTAANDRRKSKNLLAMQGPTAPPEARAYNPVDSFNPNFNPSSNDTLGLNSKSDQSQSKLMAGPQGGANVNPLNSFNPELTGGIQTPGNLALNKNPKNSRPVLLANKTQSNANPGPL